MMHRRAFVAAANCARITAAIPAEASGQPSSAHCRVRMVRISNSTRICVRQEFVKTLALRSRLRKAGWWN